jgi:hypothetical protein
LNLAQQRFIPKVSTKSRIENTKQPAYPQIYSDIYRDGFD